MEYSFFPRGRAKENAIVKGRGVCIVGVCAKRLAFVLLMRDALVGVLFMRCSLSRTRPYDCTCLWMRCINTSCVLSSRHNPYIVAQRPILLALYGNELVVVQKNGAIAYQLGRAIGLCVNHSVRCVLASDSETFHYPSSEVDFIGWTFKAEPLFGYIFNLYVFLIRTVNWWINISVHLFCYWDIVMRYWVFMLTEEKKKR
jgi:hypothetical protein